MVLEAVFDERGQAGIGLDHDVAAVTAVAAVRTALRHMGLAAKRHAAGAAVAAFDMDAYFIDEHGWYLYFDPRLEGRNGLLA